MEFSLCTYTEAICTDFQKVNTVTKTYSYPIPRIDCIDKLGNVKYVTKFDPLKGYWQVPLTEMAKKLSSFVIRKVSTNTKSCISE